MFARVITLRRDSFESNCDISWADKVDACLPVRVIILVEFRDLRNDKESQKSDVLVSRLTRQYITS